MIIQSIIFIIIFIIILIYIYFKYFKSYKEHIVNLNNCHMKNILKCCTNENCFGDTYGDSKPEFLRKDCDENKIESKKILNKSYEQMFTLSEYNKLIKEQNYNKRDEKIDSTYAQVFTPSEYKKVINELNNTENDSSNTVEMSGNDSSNTVEMSGIDSANTVEMTGNNSANTVEMTGNNSANTVEMFSNNIPYANIPHANIPYVNIPHANIPYAKRDTLPTTCKPTSCGCSIDNFSNQQILAHDENELESLESPYHIYDNTIFTSLEKNNENAKESKEILDSSYNQIFTPAEYNKLIGEHSLYNNYYTYNNYKRQIYKYNKLFDYENNNINNLVGEDSFNKIIDTDYGDKSGYSL